MFGGVLILFGGFVFLVLFFFGFSVVVIEDILEVWLRVLKVKLIFEGDDCWDVFFLVVSFDELFLLINIE